MDVGHFLARLDVPWRQVASGEWGLSFADVGGWPLHVGLRVEGAWLSVQAEVRSDGELDPWALLHRNRLDAVVRFTSTSGRAVWVQADVPWPCAEEVLDRVLAGVVAATEWARAAVRDT